MTPSRKAPGRWALVPHGWLWWHQGNRLWLQSSTSSEVSQESQFSLVHKEGLSFRGAWAAQSVEHPTLDFSSGHDPRVVGSSPTSGSVLSMEPAWDSPSLSLPLPFSLLTHTLSLSKLNNNENKIKSFEKHCCNQLWCMVGLAAMGKWSRAGVRPGFKTHCLWVVCCWTSFTQPVWARASCSINCSANNSYTIGLL